MKVGTVPKITVSAAVIIGLGGHRDSPFHIVEGGFGTISRNNNINLGTPNRFYS